MAPLLDSDRTNSTIYEPIASPGLDPSSSHSSNTTATTAWGHRPEWLPTLGPHTLRHLSIWAYFALAFVVFTVVVVMVYACYSCCRSSVVRIERKGDGRGGWKRLEGRSDTGSQKKHPQENMVQSNSGPEETSFSSGDTSQSTISDYEHSKLVKFPTGISSPGQSSVESDICKPINTRFDAFSIPFVVSKGSGSMKGLWADPKLSPIHGAIIRPEPAKLTERR